jgi:phospholipase/carboxylesterase
MLPHGLSERAAETLRQNGLQVGLHIAQGVGHGINDTALSHAARFLLEAFKLPMPKQEAR